MRSMKALFVAAWLPAACLAPQQPTAPEPAPIAAVVTIDDAEQFCPTTCRFRIDVPGTCDDIVTQVPYVQFFREMPSGEWWHATGPPGGRNGYSASLLFSPAPNEGLTQVRWRFRAGESTSFFGEVADWRVLGYPGTYQVRVQWAIEGAPFRNATAEFEVRPAGDGGAALLAAQTAQDEVWRAYQSFMSRGLVVAEISSFRPPGYQAPSPTALQFLQAVQGLTVGSCDPLLQAGSLPEGLRERLDLFLLKKPWIEANVMSDAVERTQALRRVLSLYMDFGTRPGFAGAFARLQALVLTKSCGTKTEFDAAFASALQDRDLLDLGLSYPEAMQAVGLLVEDEASLPGPAGPRSPLGGILERR